MSHRHEIASSCASQGFDPAGSTATQAGILKVRSHSCELFRHQQTSRSAGRSTVERFLDREPKRCGRCIVTARLDLGRGADGHRFQTEGADSINVSLAQYIAVFTPY